MASVLKLDTIQDPTGVKALDLTKLASNTGRYTRQIVNLIDTTDRTTSTTWTLGTTFSELTGFKAGSLLKISYMYPCRNDAQTWGGIYFEPQIQFNSEGWQSLGSRGYDAVMNDGAADISFTSNIMLINPGKTSDFSVTIRFYFRSYDGTVGIVNGGGHEINTVSGTATIMSGTNGQQHYGNWIIEELATFR